MLSHNLQPRLIAFYLPQFHPIHENDRWWGKGFTEWTNVAKARPLFPGHYQPHLPADLGFYDLRLPEARQAQAELARTHGISGFCYYHYWFNGKQLLERPFNEVLTSGMPDFPFCLCWANENWTRAWDGLNQNILLAEQYSEEDDRNHIHWLCRAFADKRYIRIEGRPVFLIYRAGNLPDARHTTTLWREEARKQGAGELYLCKVESFPNEHADPAATGFDAAVEFQPDWTKLGVPLQQGRLMHWLRRLRLTSRGYGRNRIYDYAAYVRKVLESSPPPYKRIPCVVCSWDNTARRASGAIVLHNSTPDKFELWLRSTLHRTSASSNPQLVFINAWNEWGEGAHLEPCQKWGRAYLEATQRAVHDVQCMNDGVLPRSL